jgi:AcrR family transcriptional regulator
MLSHLTLAGADMPSPRFKNLAEAKQHKILLAAGREFAEHGYDGATISLILEHAGLSTGAAYYYFHNKADLFAEVVRFYMALMFDGKVIELQANDADSFWQEIVSLAKPAIDESQEIHRILGGLKAAWKHSKEARDIEGVQEQFDRQENVLKYLVKKGRDVGAVRTDLPEDLLVCMLQSFDEGFDNWLQLQPPDWQPMQLMPLFVELLIGIKQLIEPKR